MSMRHKFQTETFRKIERKVHTRFFYYETNWTKNSVFLTLNHLACNYNFHSSEKSESSMKKLREQKIEQLKLLNVVKRYNLQQKEKRKEREKGRKREYLIFSSPSIPF